MSEFSGIMLLSEHTLFVLILANFLTMKREFLIVTHYSKDDLECEYDYIDIAILEDGILIQEYGDSYHDKGKEKTEGFIDAIIHVYGKKNILVHKKNVADREI